MHCCASLTAKGRGLAWSWCTMRSVTALDIESTSARITAAGFVAITPNLYSRGGRARCIIRVFRELLTQRGRALDDILAARDRVQSMPDCTGSVGVVGFCMGGQFALVMAPKGFGASAPFYGTPLPRHLSETLDGACPIVASFGRRDPLSIRAPVRLRKVVEDKALPPTSRCTRTPATASRTSCRASRYCGSPDSATTTRRPKTPTAASSRSSTSTWPASNARTGGLTPYERQLRLPRSGP
jgi:dienelactone hydrolase